MPRFKKLFFWWHAPTCQKINLLQVSLIRNKGDSPEKIEVSTFKVENDSAFGYTILELFFNLRYSLYIDIYIKRISSVTDCIIG